MDKLIELTLRHVSANLKASVILFPMRWWVEGDRGGEYKQKLLIKISTFSRFTATFTERYMVATSAQKHG
jgi:hypothetical protein